MKKILVLFILFLTSGSVWAKNIQVECLTPVNAEMETPEFNAKVLKESKFKSGLVFKKNDVINMKIKKFVPAKAGSRSAYIVVQPVSFVEEEEVQYMYHTETETKYIPINDETLEGKTTSIKVLSKEDVKNHIKEDWKQDLGKVGKGVTKKVVNTALPGAEQMYQVSKGLIKPNEGQTRLQSAANNFIDDTPLKHLKKGHDVDIKAGDKIVLKFYHTDVPKWRVFKRNG